MLGCGPEVMNRYLLKACKELQVPCQLSLERLMKCGAGLCGSCVIDGRRVCAEGPVFTGGRSAEMTSSSGKGTMQGRVINFRDDLIDGHGPRCG